VGGEWWVGDDRRDKKVLSSRIAEGDPMKIVRCEDIEAWETAKEVLSSMFYVQG